MAKARAQGSLAYSTEWYVHFGRLFVRLLIISIINFHEGSGPLGATWAEKTPLFEDGHCDAMHSTNGKYSRKRLVLVFFLLFEAILGRNSRTFGGLAPRRLSGNQVLGLSKTFVVILVHLLVPCGCSRILCRAIATRRRLPMNC